ncbi:succinate dehydrogenase assembly factor 4 [Cucumis melo var. makuwa]|uniref:Succinate dehydrogenase assembly factor 4, mitochondrial n=1 Tax=Cucumis melo var. makuwa TaxID=1194695 RepID=A0A5A7TMD3_CUCMM|nr:succinate dehydrogenase assembly factor 4 [Cucumis melo var. makuwa]TYK05959.1 succinate dehydrogenase assembly factor 4 [Cucumis melo var. makuwa]
MSSHLSRLFSSPPTLSALPTVGRLTSNSLSRFVSSSSNQQPSRSEQGVSSEEQREAEKGSSPNQHEAAGDDRGSQDQGVDTEKMAPEIGGPKGHEPTRYGDWERNGRCYDF